MKRFWFLVSMILIVLSFTACNTTFYQVYTVKAEGLQSEENYLYGGNSDCFVCYNLWAEDGTTAFVLTNNTDNDMYVVMPQTTLIRNGLVYDYYSEDVVTSGYTVGVSVGASISASLQKYYLDKNNRLGLAGLGAGLNAGRNLSLAKEISHRDVAYVLVPPHASRMFRGFSISKDVYTECNAPKQNRPKMESTPVLYDKSNTPLVFRNRIAYTFNKNSSDVKYIEHQFFVEKLQNFSKKAFYRKEKYKGCNDKVESVHSVENYYAPNCYYSIYHDAGF